MIPDELADLLIERFKQDKIECLVDKGHAVAIIPVNILSALLKALKNDELFDFDMLMDLTAVDWLERKPRFDVVYHFYSTKHNHRLRVKVAVDEIDQVPTASDSWKIADPMEREVWDLYGIKFVGHPNLTRLLLYEEFKGHPLRKDYPYDKRQPLIEETWPSRNRQVKVDDRGIHRP